MYSVIFKFAFALTAFIITLFFVGVVVLHPFAMHDHASVHFGNDGVATLHTGVVDRGQSMALVVLIFFVLTPFVHTTPRLLPALFKRGLQDVDIPRLLSLQLAFRAGILNTKVY